MLARFSVPVQIGHHYPDEIIRLRQPPIGRPEQFIVHHFKWQGDLLERIEWMLARQNTPQDWRGEAYRFLDWLRAAGGRIDIDDPALEAKNLLKNPPRP